MSSSRRPTNQPRKRRPTVGDRATAPPSSSVNGPAPKSAVEAARLRMAMEETKVNEVFDKLNLPEEYRGKIEGMLGDQNIEEYMQSLLSDKEKQQHLLRQWQDGINNYIDADTQRIIQADADTLIAWVKTQKTLKVYQRAKVILRILKDYITRRDPVMFQILKRAIPAMQTDLYALYQQQIVDRGLADHEFVAFAWMCIAQLTELLQQFQENFTEDEAKVEELVARLPDYVRMVLARLKEMQIEIPEWITIMIDNFLQHFK